MSHFVGVPILNSLESKFSILIPMSFGKKSNFDPDSKVGQILTSSKFRILIEVSNFDQNSTREFKNNHQLQNPKSKIKTKEADPLGPKSHD